MYNLDPITLLRKNDKKTFSKITIRGLLVTFLSEYIRHNRKLSIIFNFRFNMYDKKFEKLESHDLDSSSPWLLIAVAPRDRYCSGATLTVAVAVASLLLAESSGDGSAATFLVAF